MALAAPLRALNRLGRAYRALGGSPRALDADAIVAHVLHTTGRTDLGDPTAYRPALDAFLADLAPGDRASTTGIVMARRRLVTSLSHRARALDWRAHAPERFDTELRPPIVVLGLPRTGTTFLHRLLAAAPDTRVLTAWEVADPWPPLSGPDHRRQHLRVPAAIAERALPDLFTKHATGLDAPEECMHLMAQAVFWWNLWAMYGGPTYKRFLHATPPTAAYRAWGDVLRFYQSQDSRRFVLKSPSHVGHLNTLLAEVPSARIVWTHRDPVESVPSFASLVRTLREVGTVPSLHTSEAVGPDVLDHLGQVADRAVAHRHCIPSTQLVDVTLKQLRTEPLAVVERIHTAFGLPWDGDTERRVRAVVAQREARKRTVAPHAYSAADFGLTDAAVRERFSAYAAVATDTP